MEIQGYNLPDDLYYEKNHFWVKADGDELVMGMDDFAQKMAGEIVYIQLPDEGKKIKLGKVLNLESFDNSLYGIFRYNNDHEIIRRPASNKQRQNLFNKLITEYQKKYNVIIKNKTITIPDIHFECSGELVNRFLGC